jgi:hypothetical protein
MRPELRPARLTFCLEGRFAQRVWSADESNRAEPLVVVVEPAVLASIDNRIDERCDHHGRDHYADHDMQQRPAHGSLPVAKRYTNRDSD